MVIETDCVVRAAAAESETKCKLRTTTTDHVGSIVVTKSPEDETQKDNERAISLELP